MEHVEYTLKLRPREIRWHLETKEEVLVGKSGRKRLPGEPKPPLASEDELSFRLETQNQTAV